MFTGPHGSGKTSLIDAISHLVGREATFRCDDLRHCFNAPLQTAKLIVVLTEVDRHSFQRDAAVLKSIISDSTIAERHPYSVVTVPATYGVLLEGTQPLFQGDQRRVKVMECNRSSEALAELHRLLETCEVRDHLLRMEC